VGFFFVSRCISQLISPSAQHSAEVAHWPLPPAECNLLLSRMLIRLQQQVAVAFTSVAVTATSSQRMGPGIGMPLDADED